MLRFILISLFIGAYSIPATAASAHDIAEAAVAALEEMPGYEGAAIGVAAVKGRNYRELEKVMALGEEAMPYLQRLSGSSLPSARMAAVAGLARLKTAQARTLIMGMTSDSAIVRVYEGCMGTRMTVGAFALQTLQTHFGMKSEK